jgi:hypothetical protein
MGPDGNHDGTIDAADYIVWRMAFDTPPGTGAFAPSSNSEAVNQSGDVLAAASSGAGSQFAAATEVLPTPPAELSVRGALWAVPRRPIATRSISIERPAAANGLDPTRQLNRLIAERLMQSIDAAHADSDGVPVRTEACEDLIDHRPQNDLHDSLHAEIWRGESWLSSAAWRPKLGARHQR